MVARLRKNPRQRVEQFRGRIEVRKPLREVDAPDLRADPRHLTDHRLLKGPRAPRQ